MLLSVNVSSLFQKRVQVPLLLRTGHRDGGHDAGLPALGQRAGHGAAPGAAASQPQQPLLRLAQVRARPARPPPRLRTPLPLTGGFARIAALLVLPADTPAPCRAPEIQPQGRVWPRHPSASFAGSSRPSGESPRPRAQHHGLLTARLVLLSRLIPSGFWDAAVLNCLRCPERWSLL